MKRTVDKILITELDLARASNANALGRLRQAIIDNTKGDLFWIGEILLAELEKETGFKASP